MEAVALTEAQISGILTEIPRPPGVGKTAIQIAHRQHLSRIKDILEDIKLVPLDEAYERYKNELIRSSYESLIEPGRFVGVGAGVALGGPVTQLSLNSFHFAGAQSGVAQAFQKVRDFLTGSRIKRDPQMNIFFKLPGTGTDLYDAVHKGDFDSIMSKRAEFEQTTVEDVVIDTEILTREEAEIEGISEIVALHSQLRPERFTGGQARFPLNYVVKLTLNTYRMYSHRITMSMLAAAIEGPAPPDSITVVWKSQFEGRAYIIVDETRSYEQQGMSQESAILMFLHLKIIRDFGSKQISGMSGIVSIEPQQVDVTRGIYQVKTSKGRPDLHRVYSNNFRTRWEGVSLADIQQLLRAAGFRVEDIKDENKEGLYLTVQHEGNVWEDLQSRIKAAREKAIPERSEQEQEIAEASSFYYMKTQGINMNDVTWRDDIDVYRLSSNNSHDVQENLGIDAARVFLILKFRQTLQDFGSYINGRHISLIFDLLTNLGTINSLSFTGVNRRRIGPLAMASYERAMDVFANSAVYGDKESIVGVSPALYVGQLSKRGGTGSISLEEDLTAIPRDQPTFPSVDEDTILDDIVLDEDVLEGSGFAEIVTGEEVRRTRAMLGKVDKNRIRRPIEISSIPVDIPPNILPSGAQVVMASQTLMSALQKVTADTNLEVEPIYEVPQLENPTDVVPDLDGEIPDITTLSDISDLSLITPQKLVPSPPAPTVDIMSQLRAIPTEGIIVPEQPVTVSTLPEPSLIEAPERPISPTQTITVETPLQFTVAGGPISPRQFTGTVSEIPTPLRGPPQELPQPEPVRRVKGIITDEPVPQIPPPPPVGVPHPPRHVIEAPEEGRPQLISYSGPPSQTQLSGLPEDPIPPSSFLDQLPNLSDVTVRASTRGNVSRISTQGFLQIARKE